MFIAEISVRKLGGIRYVELFARTRKRKERRMFSSRIRDANDTEMEHRVFITQSDSFFFFLRNFKNAVNKGFKIYEVLPLIRMRILIRSGDGVRSEIIQRTLGTFAAEITFQLCKLDSNKPRRWTRSKRLERSTIIGQTCAERKNEERWASRTVREPPRKNSQYRKLV